MRRRPLIIIGMAAVVIITAAVVALLATAGGGTETKEEARTGVYREAEVEEVVGYRPRLPRRLPDGLSRAGDRVVVLRGGGVAVGFDARGDRRRPERTLDVSQAPRGKLDTAPRGLRRDTKEVSVSGARGTIDTWEKTTPYRPLTSRFLVWSASDFDYRLTGYGLSDDELVEAANSM